MKKREKVTLKVSEYEGLFRCPICAGNMKVMERKSFVCENRHTFDFTKSGYVNFLNQTVATKYGKDLFLARQELMSGSDFFTPVVENIRQYVQEIDKENLIVADMGCGEGTHFIKICEGLTNLGLGMGIDIAKEGIVLASKATEGQFWLVGDIANTPLKDEKVDVLLNILSPANYEEFRRVVTDQGQVIKVVPASQYLQELRTFFYEEEKQTYSNADTVELFEAHFQMIRRERLTYTVELEENQMGALLQMTPLTWNFTTEKKSDFLKQSGKQITIDLEILTGKKLPNRL